MNDQTLCFVAGRSGGHLLPAITIAQKHKAEHPHARLLFFSTNTNLDTHIAGAANIIDHYIPLSLENVPKKITHYPRFAWRAFRVFLRSVQYLHKYKPSTVISTGGYISIPVCFAAKLLRIPVELHELNAVPGKAAKVLAPLSDKITVCFNAAKKYFSLKKCHFSPYPVRFITLEQHLTRQKACQILNLSLTKRTLFILGGSQGSVFINNLVKQWIKENPEFHDTLQIIHQTGAHDTTDWHAFYADYKIPAIIFAYHDSIEQYYSAADLIICRSGAGTLWEIVFFGKKSITIPLETTSTNHQVDNAKALVAQYPHLFTLVTQKQIIENPKAITELINQLLNIAK